MFSTTVQRLALYALVVSQVAIGGPGCRERGSAQGPGRGGNAANAATGQTQSSTLGELGFRILRRNLELGTPTGTAQAQVAALDARRGEVVAAIDTIVPPSISGQLSVTLGDVVALVRDGTLPSLTDSLASVLDLVALAPQDPGDPQDPQRITLEALARMTRARSPVGASEAMKLGGRLLAYPELDELLRGIAGLVQENDGLDAQGRPNAERDLLGEDLALITRALRDLPRQAQSAATPAAPSKLTTALLEPVTLRGGLQTGAPAWSVRADANGNPKVNVDPGTGRLYAPFVDRDNDRVADIDAGGNPIDAQGAAITLAPFGNDGRRDAEQRLVDAQGRPVLDYFDVKKTALGQVALILGRLLERDVPLDLLHAIDRSGSRTTQQDANGTFVGYADDHPATDLAWALLEVFRYRDAPKLLDSAAKLIRQDPRKAERILVHLVRVIDIIGRQPASQATSQATGRSALDDLVPLLDKVFESGGGGQTGADSVARDILRTFRTEMQRLRRIPVGLAEMMKFSDYAARTPTGPGQKSCLEQLMDMMAEANGCDSWPFGNMAAFYLDAMAGNKRILGITINIHTINQLLDIPFLRSLLCSRISAGNIRALHAFAQSGALDALIPIVKAFSDRGQTTLLKNIFLSIGASYPGSLRPNEATLVQVLESGVVEEVFDALNTLSTMTVPGTAEPVNDVVAQFVAAIVDVNRSVRDRRGATHLSLLHLVLKPVEELSQRIDQRGLRATWDRAVQGALDVALETTQVNFGSSQSPSVETGLLYHGLVKVLAGGLETLSAAMSLDPVARNRDITTYQRDAASLMTGRAIPLIVDNVLTIERSPSRVRILASIRNVFTPNLSARHDIYGSVLEVLATALQMRSGDPAATTDVLRFAGRALDPARGLSKPIIVSLMRLLAGRGNTTVTAILRNALDRGPAGTGRAPAETLLSAWDDIAAAGRPQGASSGPTTAQDVADGAAEAARFLRDRQSGLAYVYDNLLGRR